MELKQMLVTHRPCGTTWAIADLPIDARELAKLTRKAQCPKCQGTSEIFLASKIEAITFTYGSRADG